MLRTIVKLSKSQHKGRRVRALTVLAVFVASLLAEAQARDLVGLLEFRLLEFRDSLVLVLGFLLFLG